ncbi:hypothetical protein [Streptomyces sp. XD-27]|uniref:hypothetical protein n=1 Tax=Streptomyces sp. XD-27 TaxID=3062779 RepID=UPI0026F4348F|nr:hypothetical protein [Streptomyces sp. XD-27]WKX72343.1 hypothetical protein Q3Y56_22740 [Streptomyces sp. XD-27]
MSDMDLEAQEPRERLLTLRVDRVSSDGRVTEKRPPVEFRPGDYLPALMSHVYPPCACPRCPRHRDQ